MNRTDGVSPGLARFLAGLTDQERSELIVALGEERTFLAEGIEDVVAILDTLER